MYGNQEKIHLASSLLKNKSPNVKAQVFWHFDFELRISPYLSLKTATPGRVLPSRNSSDAPPPVEIWVIFSPTPAFFTAAAVSPPPMILVALELATSLATAIVPWLN